METISMFFYAKRWWLKLNEINSSNKQNRLDWGLPLCNIRSLIALNLEPEVWKNKSGCTHPWRRYLDKKTSKCRRKTPQFEPTDSMEALGTRRLNHGDMSCLPRSLRWGWWSKDFIGFLSNGKLGSWSLAKSPSSHGLHDYISKPSINI